MVDFDSFGLGLLIGLAAAVAGGFVNGLLQPLATHYGTRLVPKLSPARESTGTTEWIPHPTQQGTGSGLVQAAPVGESLFGKFLEGFGVSLGTWGFGIAWIIAGSEVIVLVLLLSWTALPIVPILVGVGAGLTIGGGLSLWQSRVNMRKAELALLGR